MKRTVLFISNGFAEDMIGANLARELRNLDSQLEFYALPVVGTGSPYRQAEIDIIGPHWNLPSQGWPYGEGFNLMAELKAGAIQLYLGQIWALLKVRRRIDLVIGIGDYLSCTVSGILIKKPLVYVWTMASHFDSWAKYFLRKYAIMIFSRFKYRTHLPEFQVEYIGNPLMDTFEITGDDLGIDRSLQTLGVFPGSRSPAYNNVPVLIESLRRILGKKTVNIVFGMSPQIDMDKFIGLARAQAGFSEKMIFTHKFGDVLNVSDLILGLANSANEQAAGLGKPVVTFWGGGHSSRSEALVKWHADYFMKEGTLVLPPNPQLIADSILSLLDNPDKMKKMGEVGKDLNGGTGGTRVIAERIKSWLAKN